ncbi:hypothetical protein V2J09_007375 [Rumex salicifolius]
MAISRLLTVRLAFMFAGVLSTAMMLKLSLPVFIEFLNCEIPYLWSIAVIWLKPPYLYLVLNCIILTIVASTKLQPQIEPNGFPVAPIPVQIKVQEDVFFADPSPIKPVSSRIDADPVASPLMFGYVDDAAEKEVSETTPDEKAVVGTGDEVAEEELVSVSEMLTETENEEFVLSRSNWMPPRKRNPAGNYSVSTEKPLVSQRFSYRKSAKASPEGGKVLLGVSKPKRQDTLESTWRMITEGRPMPLTRHLKKSDTWDTQGRGGRDDDSQAASLARPMKKSDTFNDRATSNNPSPGGGGGGSGRLRREPSLSQDELNRRVEAFIRKFNEEMRLQRQQSLKQYSDMVGRETR